jgi:hypothetical protein
MGGCDDVAESPLPGDERVRQPDPVHSHRHSVQDDPAGHASPWQENFLQSESVSDQQPQQVNMKLY